MSADKRTPRRKPLTDCTNTVVNSSFLPSSFRSKQPSSSTGLSKASNQKNVRNASQSTREEVHSLNVVDPSSHRSHPVGNLLISGSTRRGGIGLRCEEGSTTPRTENSSKVNEESVASISTQDPCTSGSHAGGADRIRLGSVKKYGQLGRAGKGKDLDKAATDQLGADTSKDYNTPNARSVSSVNAGPYDRETTRWSRRHPAVKRKALSSSLLHSPGDIYRLTSSAAVTRQSHKEVGISKSCSIPRQKHKKKSRDCGSQDYIEKQRAYFAEVDAFELVEEAVSDTDLE